MQRSRREVLGFAGGLLAGLAGCLDRSGSGTSTDESPTDTASPKPSTTTRTDTETDTDTDHEPTSPGSFRWANEVDGRIWSAPLYHDGLLYVGSDAGTLYAFDASDGTVRWTADAPNPVGTRAMVDTALHVAGGKLLAVSGSFDGLHGQKQRVHAFSPTAGDELWTYFPEVSYEAFGLMGVADDAVVVGTNNDALGDGSDPAMAVNLADGSERWRTELGDASGAALADDAVFVTTQGSLHALSMADGSALWRQDADDLGVFTPAFDGTNVYYGVDGENGFVGAYDPATGEERWRFDEWFINSYRVADAAYVGGARLASLDSQGGSRWENDAGGLVRNAPIVDGRLVGFRQESVFAVNVADGTEAWTVDTDADYVRPLTHADGVLVLGDYGSGRLFGHAVDSGKRLWAETISEDGYEGPVIGDGAVFATSENGTVVARDLRG